MKQTKNAFAWIVKILRENKIPFIISGGLAANVYGSKRTLADIDIEVHDRDLFKLYPLVKKYAIFGPKMYKDKEWILPLMTLSYRGQEIDLCGIDSFKLFSRKKGVFDHEIRDLNKFSRKKVFSMIVPVIPLEELLNYKQKLSRKVDVLDIKALTVTNHKKQKKKKIEKIK